MRNKAQAWGVDMMLALTIFIGGLVLLYLYTINITPEADVALGDLAFEANILADTLMSEGYPLNWNTTNVVRPGLLSDNKINETKLERFAELANVSYNQTKGLLNTRYEYYLTLSQPIIINGSTLQGLGVIPENQIRAIKITRFTVYQQKPVSFDIIIWERQ